MAKECFSPFLLEIVGSPGSLNDDCALSKLQESFAGDPSSDEILSLHDGVEIVEVGDIG